ncbi:MAG: hypothetical protein D6801_02835 [Alphaproteobacteria bacterium]|nr:MAG: hypothetical protein D6801_02835 [Alphaproteobacteria bacterium]
MRERAVGKWIGTSLVAGFAALGVAACCVLPMSLMMLGLGGAWVAVFGKVAAWSVVVLAVSSLLVAAAWAIAVWRRSVRGLRLWLSASTMLTALGWIVFLNEARINDQFIAWM